MALALLAWGCSSNASNGATGGGTAGSSSGGTTNPSATLPCAVDQVLVSRCQSCHGSPPLYGAPMPLVTFADLHAATPSNTPVPVYQTVEIRTHDDAAPMPQPPNPRLSAADQATLDSWIAAGAPPGDGSTCDTSADGDDAGASDEDAAPTDCTFDTHLAPASPYTMNTPEQYVCYGFDVPAGPEHHVTQIQVHLDNKAIVHHILLLLSPTSVSSTPTPCDPGPSLGATMLYAWALGGNPLIVPPEAGFPQTSSTHYMVQVHYSNAANLPNPSDSTGFDLCTTPNLRKYDANVIAFGTELISIPPRASATTTTCLTVPSSLDGTTFFAAFPHMHELGTAISTELLVEGGAPIDMGTIPTWQFSNQPWLTINSNLSTGDIVRTTCSWNNPGDTTVNFGQDTTDEMCFSFSAYYPAASPAMAWAAPALASVPCP
jgi:hypothetical protein